MEPSKSNIAASLTGRWGIIEKKLRKTLDKRLIIRSTSQQKNSEIMLFDDFLIYIKKFDENFRNGK